MTGADLQKLLLYFAISYAVLSACNLLWTRRRQLGDAMRIYRSGWRDYLHALVIIVITVHVVWLLWAITPDLLHYGWLSLLSDSGGSLFSAPVAAARDNDSHRVLNLIGLAGFYTMMVFAMPFLAREEEKIFRARQHTRRQILVKSTKFGLAHLIVGIPVFAALGLIVTGLLFASVYLKSYRKAREHLSVADAEELAVEQSSRIHALYNFILLNIISLPVMVMLASSRVGTI